MRQVPRGVAAEVATRFPPAHKQQPGSHPLQQLLQATHDYYRRRLGSTCSNSTCKSACRVSWGSRPSPPCSLQGPPSSPVGKFLFRPEKKVLDFRRFNGQLLGSHHLPGSLPLTGGPAHSPTTQHWAQPCRSG
ncbi:pancreatic progenitor cell differentiation and proliferation factor-like [Crocuta crocuta]